MKVFIKKLLFFIILIPLAWIIGILIYGKITPGFLQKNVKITYYKNFNALSLKEIDTLQNTDILIAGPSTAFRSFDPRIFKKDSTDIFILGTSAQSPVQTEFLLKKYVDKVKPKLFIYVANMQSFSSDGVEGWLFLINNTENYNTKFINAILSTKSYYLYNALCYNLINNKIGAQKPYQSNFEHYVSNGYVGYNSLIHDTVFYTSTYNKILCDFPDYQKDAFSRIMQLFKERSIPVLIIQAPLYKPFFSSFSNSKEIDDYFRSFPGAHYMNLNYSNFDKYDFWDMMHLNQNGVIKLDNMIIDSLKKLNYIPKNNGVPTHPF